MERDVALLSGDTLISLAERAQERQRTIVLAIDFLRFFERAVEFFGGCANAHAVDETKIECLRVWPINTSHLCRKKMEIGIRIVVIAL